MNFAIMVVLVVFISFAGTLLLLYQIKSLRRASESYEKDAQLREQLANLEERVRTLERIATDEKAKLKDRIDAL